MILIPKATLAVIPAPRQQRHMRRIFNNDQLIERFGKWLLVIGKAENTRISISSAQRVQCARRNSSF
jgi:hypothetical protein